MEDTIEAGVAVRTAIDATEVLDILQTWTPDVLLIDIGMPVADGYELLKRIRGTAGGGSIPAVAVIRYAYERDRQRCIAAGFARNTIAVRHFNRLAPLHVRSAAALASCGACLLAGELVRRAG